MLLLHKNLGFRDRESDSGGSKQSVTHFIIQQLNNTFLSKPMFNLFRLLRLEIKGERSHLKNSHMSEVRGIFSVFAFY
jgi:hypothetical protein